MINYEGPYVNWQDTIDNPHLKRIINVWGTAPNSPVTGQYTGKTCAQGRPCLDRTKKPVPVGDFGPPSFANGTPLSFDLIPTANFGATSSTFENINIKIIGARHNDFAYREYDERTGERLWNPIADAHEPERIAREINFKTSRFMRDLYRAAKEEDQVHGSINDFFSRLIVAGVANLEGDVWVVNAQALPYALEYDF